MSAAATFKWTKVDPPYGRLMVHKVNDMGAPLAGAVFSIESTDGSSRFNGTSDSNGLVTFERLDPNKQYVLRETQALEGYQIADPVNISVPAGQTRNEVVTNYSNRSFQIRKVDAQNGSPLIGATFRFEQVDGGYTTEATTGHDGVISFKGSELPFGTYRVFEQAAPAGYTKDTKVETVTWDGKKDVFLTFSNVRTPSFTLIKIDAATNRSLEGAVFGVYKDGKLITTVTTNNAGTVRIPNVTEGYWEVEELIAPNGYVLDKTRHGIYINPYDPAAEADPVLVVSNKAKPGLKIVKYDRESMTPMPGVIFEVFRDAVSLGTYTTDSRGEITLTDLAEGVYTAKEIAADSSHIVNSCPQTIQVTAGTTQTLVFFNDLKPNVRIVKVDRDTLQPLQGAVFNVTKVGGGFSQDFTTDRDGEIELTSLETGAYEIREKLSPVGYLLDDSVRVIDVQANQNATFVFTDTKEPVLELLKIDADTNQPLAGATFKIRRIGDGTRYYDRTTDSSGKISIAGLEPGIWSVQEIVSPAGYQLNNKEYHVELFPGQTSQLIVENQIKPSLKIIKLDNVSMKPMSGTVFEVWRDATLVGTYTTDAKGEINLTDIPTGTYLVKEVATDNEHVVNSVPQQIEVKADSGNTAVLVFINQLKPGIRLLKLDAQTLKPLAGVRFLIEKVGGGFSQEFVTDASGEIILKNMEPGAYQAKELSAGPDHLIDDALRVFQIEPDGDAVFVFTNTKKPSLRLIKVDADTGAVLAGATYRLARVENGSRYLDRTTDANGMIEVSGLEPGVWSCKELVAPAGYQLDEQEYHVELFPGHTSQIILKNQIKPSLKIIKLDNQTMTRLKDATFEVYKDALLIGVYTTDDTGEINLSNLTPGTYLVKETAVDSSHVVNSVPQQIEIKADSRDTAVLVFVNQLKPGIHILKLDSQTMKPLKDATFRVTRIGGGFEQEYKTDANGEIDLTKLEPGTYEIFECAVPDGYLIDNGVRTFNVGPDENGVYVFTNTRKPTLKLLKVDADTNEPLSGATFRIAQIEDGTRYLDRTTDANGVIEISDLEPGVFSVKEIISPSGYQLNEREYHVLLTAGNTSQIIVPNRIKPTLKIIKYDNLSKTPLANATFEVYKDTTLIGVYTTDAAGEILLTGLLPGTYFVKEIAVDDAHVVNSTPQQIEIKAGSRDTAVLVFFNQLKPGIHIVKVDSETMLPLANAKFKISKVGGSYEKEFTTDKNGEIDLSKLEPGAYQCLEVKAPDGFLIDDEIRTIQINPDENAMFVFTNTRKPSIEILKYDPLLDKYLPGATFRIAKIEDGSHYLDRVTDQDGKIRIDNLEPGVWSVKEIASPSNYVLNETEYHVELFGGKVSRLVVVNEIKPSLIIKKTDAITGDPIKGVVYTVKKVDGETITTVTTDEKGEALLQYLDPAVYEVTEKSVPNNYLLSTASQYITLAPNRTSTVWFKNYPKPSITINKVDAITKDPIKDAKFTIWRAVNGSLEGELVKVGDYISNAEGKIVLENVEAGWYRLKETEPAYGYSIKSPDTQDVFLEGGKNKEITFENQPKNAIVIRKVDADTGQMLPGARFIIRHASGGSSGTSGTIIGEYLTSNNGTIVVTGLKAGAYIVEETKAPLGYLMVENAPQTVWITNDETSVVETTFVNRKEAGLLIKKMDAVTKEPLSDVIFKVTDSRGGAVDESNGEFRTDENGYIFIPGLAPGAFVAQEVQTKDGYVLDNTPKTVHVEFGKLHTLEFFNTPVSSLTIKKMDESTKAPLKDAVFKITTSDGQVIGSSNGEYRTDADGLIVIHGLPASATLIIREIRAPEGYLLGDSSQTLKVEPNKAYTLDFYNKSLAPLQIKKTDAVTGKPLGGASFKVTKMNGELVGEYTTTSDGFISIPEVSPGWFVISETRAPDGYIADATPKNVEVKAEKPVLVEFVNRPMSGLSIYKRDSSNGRPLGGARFKVTKMNGELIGEYTTNSSGMAYVGTLEPGWYTCLETRSPSGYLLDETPKNVEVKTGTPVVVEFENRPLSGLRITKLDEETRQPIRDVEFEVTKKNGERVGMYRTNSSGVINLNDLDDGWYVCVEKKAAKGYLLDSRPYDVEIKNGRIADLEITNRKTSSFLIHKVDSITGKGIYGVTFLLSDAQNNPIGTYVSDQNGYVFVDKTLTDGKYFWREMEAAPGYILDTTVKTFYVEYDATSEVTWKNTPMQGQIQITKKSADANSINGFPAGTLLAGATFEIRNKAGNVVDTVVTDKNGWAASKPLPLGRYYVKESKAPAYYSLNDTSFEAELEFAGQIVRMEVLNKSIYTNVSVTKRGYTEVSPNQSIRYDFKNIANNSTVGLNSFYWRDTLPTDAVRLDKIVTGTWNAKLSYKVTYKTNLNDEYRTLSDNLQTSKNYTLAASSAALGLASNEFVTEFMFSFGTVPAGFSQVEAPYIFCNVLAGLAHEYRFTNKTDVGGLWGDQWIMANDRWVTVVYNKQTPPSLPRTGY